MIKHIYFLILLLTFLSSCSYFDPTQTQYPSPPTHFNISVLSSNKLLLNGKSITFPQLSKQLNQIRGSNTPVGYYRDNSTHRPSFMAQQVIQLIIDNQLPIRLSSKPDFSDYVTTQGISKYQSIDDEQHKY